jgi:hypothetical protein
MGFHFNLSKSIACLFVLVLPLSLRAQLLQIDSMTFNFNLELHNGVKYHFPNQSVGDTVHIQEDFLKLTFIVLNCELDILLIEEFKDTITEGIYRVETIESTPDTISIFDPDSIDTLVNRYLVKRVFLKRFGLFLVKANNNCYRKVYW